MPNSRSFRVLFVGTLMTAILGVILWSAWLFRPQGDETIRTALKNHSGAAIWWPPSWRAEHGELAPFLEYLKRGDFKGFTNERIATLKTLGGGRNAFWCIVESLRDEDETHRTISMIALSLCRFDFRGWDQEIDEFLAVASQIPDNDICTRELTSVLIQIAPGSKSAIPRLVKALERAFERKKEIDRPVSYDGPDPAQPVIEIVNGLGKCGTDAADAVPLLTKILAYEKMRL